MSTLILKALQETKTSQRNYHSPFYAEESGYIDALMTQRNYWPLVSVCPCPECHTAYLHGQEITADYLLQRTYWKPFDYSLDVSL